MRACPDVTKRGKGGKKKREKERERGGKDKSEKERPESGKKLRMRTLILNFFLHN